MLSTHSRYRTESSEEWLQCRAHLLLVVFESIDLVGDRGRAVSAKLRWLDWLEKLTSRHQLIRIWYQNLASRFLTRLHSHFRFSLVWETCGQCHVLLCHQLGMIISLYSDLGFDKEVVEDGLACQSVVARRHPSNWRKSSTLARGIGCRVLTNNHDRILTRKTWKSILNLIVIWPLRASESPSVTTGRHLRTGNSRKF